jgi:hypothetical protein
MFIWEVQTSENSPRIAGIPPILAYSGFGKDFMIPGISVRNSLICRNPAGRDRVPCRNDTPGPGRVMNRDGRGSPAGDTGNGVI